MSARCWSWVPPSTEARRAYQTDSKDRSKITSRNQRPFLPPLPGTPGERKRVGGRIPRENFTFLQGPYPPSPRPSPPEYGGRRGNLSLNREVISRQILNP